MRQPYARNFYSGDIASQIQAFIADYEPPEDLGNVIAGIVPHAGWVFSGKTAAYVFAVLKKSFIPDTIILFGTVHNMWLVNTCSIYTSGAWNTPVGAIKIDEVTAQEIVDAGKGILFDNPSAHDGEHSIEVQTPFIKYFFPEAKIVPIAVIPDEGAVNVGEIVASVAKQSQKKIVAIGTTDLTHYGYNYGFIPKGTGEKALKWMNKNDQSIIDLAVNLKAEKIIPEAQEHRNACGAGAFSAAVAFARSLGAQKGRILNYTTSFDVMPDYEFSMGVGYVGMVFER